MNVRIARSILLLCLGVWAGSAGAIEPGVSYQLHCMGCHRADGAGERGRVPSVRATLVPLSASALGRDFVMRVPGVATAPLSDDEIAALLNWMARNLSDVVVPASFRNFTAEEVGRARRHPLADVSEARRRLIVERR